MVTLAQASPPPQGSENPDEVGAAAWLANEDLMTEGKSYDMDDIEERLEKLKQALGSDLTTSGFYKGFLHGLYDNPKESACSLLGLAEAGVRARQISTALWDGLRAGDWA